MPFTLTGDITVGLPLSATWGQFSSLTPDRGCSKTSTRAVARRQTHWILKSGTCSDCRRASALAQPMSERYGTTRTQDDHGGATPILAACLAAGAPEQPTCRLLYIPGQHTAATHALRTNIQITVCAGCRLQSTLPHLPRSCAACAMPPPFGVPSRPCARSSLLQMPD